MADVYIDQIIRGVNASIIDVVGPLALRLSAIDKYAESLVLAQQQTVDYLTQIWIMVLVLCSSTLLCWIIAIYVGYVRCSQEGSLC